MIASGFDSRDFRYGANPTGLPVAGSLQAYAGAVIDEQLSSNTCTSNALTGAKEVLCRRGGLDVQLSRLFNYWNARDYFQQQVDGGSSIRFAMNTAAKLGTPLESIWPFDLDQVNNMPSPRAYESAREYKIERYSAIGTGAPHDLVQMRCALAQGFPLVIGMKMTPWEMPFLNHAMVILAYDPDGFTVKNSWGAGFADGGYSKLSNADALAHIFECWVVEGIVGVPLAPLWTPVVRSSTVYLDADNIFALCCPAKVVGASNAVLIMQPGAQDVQIDQQVWTVEVRYPHQNYLDFHQTGNVLNLYLKGRKLFSWSVPRAGAVLVVDTGYRCKIEFDGTQMVVDGKAISQEGPQSL